MNYRKIYSQLINYRQTNPATGYTEKHHILPRSLGGSDCCTNLVRVTAREHFIAHLLLTKMYQPGTVEYYKMVCAFTMMLYTRNKCVTSRTYARLREKHARIMSSVQAGCTNSQHNTMWASNISLQTSKKVPVTFELRDGWIKGRVINWDTHYSTRRCEACGKVGCESKYSRFCSRTCRSSLDNISPDDALVFLEHYKQSKSINLALKFLGKTNYYWAVRVITQSNDAEARAIFASNAKPAPKYAPVDELV